MVLSEARQVALTCHVGPDGDALGSMLGAGLLLRARGVETVASWGDATVALPRVYSFLPGADQIVSRDDFPAAPEVLMIFDTGSRERLGRLAPRVSAAGTVIIVDHHRTSDGFGDIRLVDPGAAATGTIVFDLASRLGIPMGAAQGSAAGRPGATGGPGGVRVEPERLREIATCLYTAIVTDTGMFSYRATSPAVHRMAAELLAHGVAHDEIARRIYSTLPFSFLRLAGAALSRVELLPGRGSAPAMVWTWINRADLQTHGVGLDETDALIDHIRSAEEADVACVIKEQPDGRSKASLRSKGGADVAAVAESFGGGGHALAAGFITAEQDPRAVAEAIAARLEAGADPRLRRPEAGADPRS